jgi:flagellar basal body-associated protein FliL
MTMKRTLWILLIILLTLSFAVMAQLDATDLNKGQQA